MITHNAYSAAPTLGKRDEHVHELVEGHESVLGAVHQQEHVAHEEGGRLKTHGFRKLAPCQLHIMDLGTRLFVQVTQALALVVKHLQDKGGNDALSLCLLLLFNMFQASNEW